MTQYARYPTIATSVGSVDQGAAGTAANGWWVRPTDGVNNQSFTAANEAKVSVTQPLPTGANTIGAVNQGTSPWVVSGTVGRSWTLSSGTDSVAAVQSGAWTTGRTWVLDSATDSVAVTGTVAATQSGAWTTGRTWTLASGTDSVAAVQSGAWTTGRTWTLSSATDTVGAVQSGAWAVSGTGAAGTAATGVVTVQGIAGAVAVITDQTANATTFQAEGAIPFNVLTTSFATAFTAAGNLRILQLRNSTNVTLQVSFDGGTTTHYNLEANDAVSLDLRANGGRLATGATVAVKYTGTAPTSGSFRANGAY